MTEPKKSIADSTDVSAYDESFGANLDRAAEATPVVGTVWKTGKSIAEHAGALKDADGASEVASSAAQLLGDGAKFVGSAAAEVTFFAFDPIGWLVSHGLNMLLELVQPLQDALHQVSGDGPAIGHASENFVTLAEGFQLLADDFEKTGDSALKDWISDAGDAARAALGDFSAGIRGIGSSAGSVAEVLKMWSMVMVVIEEVIKAIISELVSWLITIWLPALATSIISFGGSVAAAMTASIAKAASSIAKVTKHLGVLGRLLTKFMEFLAKHAKAIESVAKRFREGPILKAGEKPLWVLGAKVSHDAWVPSRRVLTTMLGSQAGVMPFVTGAAIKSGIGAGKSLAHEVQEEVTQPGPFFNESATGGDQSPEETRENLDI